MIDFLDSSALVKRYLPERGAESVRRATRSTNVTVARIAHAEVAATIARVCREGAIEPSERDRALDRLGEDIARWRVVELRPRIVQRVRELVCRHPLRGYDAVQLASALELRAAGPSVRLWCTDAVLCAAAAAEGLALVRPV